MREEFEIVRLGADCQALLEGFLEEVDRDFPVPLSDRVRLGEYVGKLLGNGVVLGALLGGGLVGVAAGYANDAASASAYLSVVAASRRARRSGVGRALLAAFEGEARASSMRFVRLETSRDNLPARALYEGAGYTTDGMPDPAGNLAYRKVVTGLSPERPNVLLTSAGRRSYLVRWFRDALGGEGLVCATNSDPASPALAEADVAEVSPLIYSDGYLPFLLGFCERNRVGAVVPLFDVDVPVLAAHRGELEAIGCLPVVAPEAFARACADKLAAARLLEGAGVPCVPTWLGAGEFLRAVDEGRASFPAVAKPRWGMGSIGVVRASDEGELLAAERLVRRGVESSYLRYESAADMGSCVVVQGAVEGAEYGMDVVCDLSGSYRGCVVRRKLAMRAGETDSAEVLPQGACPRFERLARSLAAVSRHPGNMDVDVFDEGGELRVLEMNARFGGGYPFSHAAGVDLPRALVAWLRGVECDPRDLEVDRPGGYMKDMSVVPLCAAGREAR